MYYPGKDGFRPPPRVAAKKQFSFDQRRESLTGWRGVSDVAHNLGTSPHPTPPPRGSINKKAKPEVEYPDAHKPSMAQLYPEALTLEELQPQAKGDSIVMSDEHLERRPGPW